MAPKVDITTSPQEIGDLARTLPVYQAHVAELKPTAQLWRIVLGGLLVPAGQAVATVVLFGLAALVLAALTRESFDWHFISLTEARTPFAVLVLLFTFSGFVAGVLAAMRFVHKAPTALLLGQNRSFDWRGFYRATAIFAAIGTVALLLASRLGQFEANLALGLWLLYLLPVALVVFVQVFAEELAFRGYLQSMLAARFASPLVWGGVPTVLFGLLHLGTALQFGANAWLYIMAPTLLGGIAAHLTVRTGNLAAATGFHFANNALIILLVAPPGPLGQFSLYTFDFDPNNIEAVRPIILGNIGLILLSYAIFLMLTPPKVPSTIATAPPPD